MAEDDGGIYAEAITSHVVEDHENVKNRAKLGAEKITKVLYDGVQGALLGVFVGPLRGIGCKGGQALLNESTEVHVVLSANLEAEGSYRQRLWRAMMNIGNNEDWEKEKLTTVDD